MGGATHRSPSDLCPLARICVIAVMPPLARIIHEHFCCNRRSAVPTSLRLAGSPPRAFDILHDYASGPPGSVRQSHDAAPRFRNELS